MRRILLIPALILTFALPVPATAYAEARCDHDGAVMAKITTRLSKGVTNGTITKTQETALSSAATSGISKLMNLNLSTYIRVRFGGFPQTPATAPSSTPSPAAATGLSTSL